MCAKCKTGVGKMLGICFRLAVDLSELTGVVSHGISTPSTVTRAERNWVETC